MAAIAAAVASLFITDPDLQSIGKPKIDPE
jgi:hypothetical protein